MRTVSGPKYEAPRAVRLGGYRTASAERINRQQAVSDASPGEPFWLAARKRVPLPDSRLVTEEG